MRILVTGAAGFIGHHLCLRFCRDAHSVVGLDNLNDYYSTALKQARLARMNGIPGFCFQHMDICDEDAVYALFARERFTHVVHMAAQAGVRYSLENPLAYARSNLYGFTVILEACRRNGVEHLLFASSSSVYGTSAQLPFSATAGADHPVSLYAATKRSNELCAHSYSSLFNLPATGLRFFTVYGPWGRPDMALFIFTRAILEGRPIPLFNMGRQRRDFTYIDDASDAAATLLSVPPEKQDAQPRTAEPDPSRSTAPFRIYNIGAGRPVTLAELVSALENCLGRKAEVELQPRRPGDVDETWADCRPLRDTIAFVPETPLNEGVAAFVAWYKEFYGSGTYSGLRPDPPAEH
ncbi:MAG: NAD-dependent epimerase/dehydratase family protein [Desulfovibrio sp.]|jgi:UDP-glucuronate 4-epimerase|nr:NAD-dependent epimerase/dehydratase family protein [Desulfovibrio sp.]